MASMASMAKAWRIWRCMESKASMESKVSMAIKPCGTDLEALAHCRHCHRADEADDHSAFGPVRWLEPLDSTLGRALVRLWQDDHPVRAVMFTHQQRGRHARDAAHLLRDDLS